MATIKDIAKMTGLSLATISKYLNGGNVLPENRELIQYSIEALGYRRNEQARGLKTNQTMTVGLLIPSFDNIFFTTIVATIEELLSAHGYGVILCAYHGDPQLEKDKLTFLMHKNVDGLVVVSYGGASEELKRVQKLDIPLVLLDHKVDGVEADFVGVKNLEATKQVIQLLKKYGHKRIALIGGNPDDYTAHQRILGYKAAFSEVFEEFSGDSERSLEDFVGLAMEQGATSGATGITGATEPTNYADYITMGDYTVQDGYNGFKKLWQLPEKRRPTAVMATNYELTIGTLMAINELQIQIPHNLSLVGFDNIQLARVVRPELSVVEQPMEALGQAVVELLLKRMKKELEGYPETRELETSVRLGGSVASIT